MDLHSSHLCCSRVNCSMYSPFLSSTPRPRYKLKHLSLFLRTPAFAAIIPLGFMIPKFPASFNMLTCTPLALIVFTQRYTFQCTFVINFSFLLSFPLAFWGEAPMAHGRSHLGPGIKPTLQQQPEP